MKQENRISIHIGLFLPIKRKNDTGVISIKPITLQTSPDNTIWTLVLAFLMFSEKFDNSSQGAFEFAKNLLVYDRVNEKFVNSAKTFDEENVEDGAMLMATTSNDKTFLNEIIKIRKASEIDMLAMDILGGN